MLMTVRADRDSGGLLLRRRWSHLTTIIRLVWLN